MTTPPYPALLLAAGEGTRMQPLTLTRPKPLLDVAGRCLLDRALDRLAEARVPRVVINTWYLGEQIAAHVADHYGAGHTPPVLLSPEPDGRLETAGAAIQARPLVGDGPFFAINSDSLWLDGPSGSALARLAAAFDPARMDALLLLVPHAQVPGFDGPGDFDVDKEGRLTRRPAGGTAPLIYIGLQVVGPGLLAGVAPGKQSFNPLWTAAQARGRLFGMIHDGTWYHVGTPGELEAATVALRAQCRPA